MARTMLHPTLVIFSLFNILNLDSTLLYIVVELFITLHVKKKSCGSNILWICLFIWMKFWNLINDQIKDTLKKKDLKAMFYITCFFIGRWKIPSLKSHIWITCSYIKYKIHIDRMIHTILIGNQMITYKYYKWQ